MGPVAFITLCLLGCLVCSPALAGTQAGFCPKGWKSHQGDCYKYFPQRRTWQEAQAECQEQGAGTHLASILSAGENNMVAEYVRQNPGSGSVWIGLSDPSENQCWGWADRSPAKFIAWDNGQPGGQTQNERCAVLEGPDFQKWHDYPCDQRFRFVCKRGSCGRQLLPAPGQ
ncbi:C-type lectin-like isoform X3 [Pelodiscus sinensis]|uniref:C-type lectin-like isoform X3 n=1 Tax=Pelodiscus sinensis TaxID=13735 RepID=UPI003F6A9053